VDRPRDDIGTGVGGQAPPPGLHPLATEGKGVLPYRTDRAWIFAAESRRCASCDPALDPRSSPTVNARCISRFAFRDTFLLPFSSFLFFFFSCCPTASIFHHPDAPRRPCPSLSRFHRTHPRRAFARVRDRLLAGIRARVNRGADINRSCFSGEPADSRCGVHGDSINI